ncbi:kinase [Chloroflexota bacterium]
MIISRTPFRISFFGGGTDYPVWYREHGGKVLGTTIDKYCYISCRYLPPFFKHKHRIVYSLVELVKDIDEIRHPAVKEVMRYIGITKGMEIHHDGDLPARTGLGSSSSFTVGLLNALYELNGTQTTKMRLAQEAIHIEQDLVKENVGSQDQTMAAFGGLNRILFKTNNSIEIQPVSLEPNRLRLFQDHLLLFYTGIARTASEIAAEQINQTQNKQQELTDMYNMVDEAVKILESDTDLEDFGRLLHENWQIKRTLTSRVTTSHIDSIYDTAMNSGATGGKLLGAGGAGFMLLFVKPELQENIKDALSDLLYVPFSFETEGSKIIVSNNEGISI